MHPSDPNLSNHFFLRANQPHLEKLLLIHFHFFSTKMPLYSSYTLMVRLMIQYVVGQGSGVMFEVLSDRTKHHKPA